MKKYWSNLVSYSLVTISCLIPVSSVSSANNNNLTNFCNSLYSGASNSATKGLWLQSSVGTGASGGTAQIAASIQDSTADGSIISKLTGTQQSGYATNNLLTPGLAFPPLPTEGATPPTTGVSGAYSLPTIVDSNLSLPRSGDSAANGVITYRIGASSKGFSIDLNSQSAITVGTGNETIVLYLDGGINLTGGSSITITPGSKLIVYARGGVNLAGTSEANAIRNSSTSDNAEIYVYSNNKVSLVGGSGMRTFIHAPYSLVEMSGNAKFAGTVWAKEWKGVGTVHVAQGNTNLTNTKVYYALASRYCPAD